MTISLDGRADDGQAGEGDNVGADVEEAVGGTGADRIAGNAAANVLRGSSGPDVILAGAAPDRVEGDEGDDTIDTRDGGYDSVDCGPGTDTVLADLGDDTVACEIAPDPDGDGFLEPADCDPFDPGVNPAADEIPGNAVDEDCNDGPAYPRVVAPISYLLEQRSAPVRVRFRRLRVSELRRGDRIRLRCRGRGCAFRRTALRVRRGTAALNLARLFERRFLRPGAVVELRILRANHIGKVHRLRVRRGGAVRSRALCLAVGARRPVPCGRL